MRRTTSAASFHLSSGYTSMASKRCVFHWNRDKLPDPAAFVASYRAAGAQLVPNTKPALLRGHPLYDDPAVSTPDSIDLTLREDGPGTTGDATLTIVLPAGDFRRLTVRGGTADQAEYEGRPALCVILDRA